MWIPPGPSSAPTNKIILSEEIVALSGSQWLSVSIIADKGERLDQAGPGWSRLEAELLL